MRRYCDRENGGYRGIMLQSARIGGKVVTTRAWIMEFIDAQTQDIDMRLPNMSS